LKLADLYFNFFFYTTKERQDLLYTIRELTSKKTIVSRKLISLEEFND